MPLRNYNRSLSVSESVSVSKNLNELLVLVKANAKKRALGDSVSEDRCNQTNSDGAHDQFGILWILMKSKNIPHRRGLVADTVTDTVTQKGMEV
jgi:hypothetical protein